MNAALLFVAMVIFAYVGNIWAIGRPRADTRRDSGLGYLGIGVLLGPSVLGWVHGAVLAEFEAPLVAAAGWLALVDELHGDAHSVDEPSSLRFSTLHGSSVVLMVTILTGATAWGASMLHPLETVPYPWVAAVGAALLAADAITRPSVVRASFWLPAPGVASRWLLGLFTAGFYALTLARPFGWSVIQVVLANVCLGLCAGITVAALSGEKPRATLNWALLLGAALISMGLCIRLGLSPVTSMVSMGATLRLIQGETSPARHLAEDTEHAVRVPLLVLFGISLGPLATYRAIWLPILALIGIRVGVRVLVASAGAALGLARSRRTDPLRTLLSWAAAPPSNLTLVVLLALHLRVGSNETAALCGAAFVLIVFSELTGERHLADADEEALNRASPEPGEATPERHTGHEH